MRPAGVFRSGPHNHYILLRTDAPEADRNGIVYHEYFHLLDSLHGPQPLWASEGLAEFFGNTSIQGKKARIGQPSYGHTQLLRSEQFLALETLFSVDRASPYYLESDRVSIFYAQSWALAHYAFLGDPTGHLRESIDTYLAMRAAGKEESEATRRAFGDLKSLEKALRTYIGRHSFNYYDLSLPSKLEKVDVSIRELTPAESAAKRAGYVVEFSRLEEGRELVEQALQLDPDLPEAHETMGILLMRERKPEDAVKVFRKTLELDPQRYLPHYYLAWLLPATDPETVHSAEVEEHLLQTIALNPKFAAGYAGLSSFYERRDPDLKRALAMARKSADLEPYAAGYRFNVGRLLNSMEQEPQARQEVAAAGRLAITQASPLECNNLCWYASLDGFADLVLPVCEQAVRLEPDHGGYRDSRGLARALTGDYSGAIEDFRYYLKWAEKEQRPELLQRREQWIKELEGGRNPFDDKTLQDLLRPVDNQGTIHEEQGSSENSLRLGEIMEGRLQREGAP